MEKKGLSGIVTTIIIIGIALVAVGVVWYTLNNVMEQQSQATTNASDNVYQSCSEVGYNKMNTSTQVCDGTIKYFGGQKCCTGTVSGS